MLRQSSMTHHRPHITFLLLALASIGLASALVGCDSPSEPGFDWTGLLTDEELRTEEDPNAPDENLQWAEWVEANNIPIRSLEAGNYSDLLSLRPYFQEARIVQLGENGHGAAEFSKVKVRTIRFLHEVMGFSVVAFESSIFECYYGDNRASSLPAEETMMDSVSDVWHCEEVLPLFKYLKERASLGKNLHLAGLDTRISSRKGVAHRPDFFKGLLATVNEDFADHVYELDHEFIERHLDAGYIPDNRDSLIAEYGAIADSIGQHEGEIAAAFPENPEVARVARQVALTVIKRIDELYLMSLGQEDQAFETRDQGMAENLEFFLNELYPGEKIVVWAHNAHVCHDYKSIPERNRVNMGGRLHELHRPELYTVGFYMYRGSAATNERETLEVPAAQSGSLESILYRTRRKYCFIDMLGQSRGDGNSWMFETVGSNEWDRGGLSFAPKDQYDGILFVDTVTPPTYVVE